MQKMLLDILYIGMGWKYRKFNPKFYSLRPIFKKEKAILILYEKLTLANSFDTFHVLIIFKPTKFHTSSNV